MATQGVSAADPGAEVVLPILSALPAETPPRPNARVYRVGPDRKLKLPSEAAKVATDGAVVEIDAGLYEGDAAVWRQNGLLIRGVGGRAHIKAAGAHAEGKAIWVVKGDDTVIDSIELSGAEVPDKNGAGIRQEGRNLTVRNVYFHDNENGILAAPRAGSTILVESSEFARNGHGDGLSHNIYVNQIDRLIVRYSYFHRARKGHQIKSRARETYILYSRIMDDVDGNSSYLVDVSEGGSGYIVGNLLQQGPKAENRVMVSYAAEKDSYPGTHLYVVNNTFVNDRHFGRFVTNDCVRRALLANNIFAGRGLIVGGRGLATEINNVIATQYLQVTEDGPPTPVQPVAALAGGFRNPAKRDYGLQPGVPAIERGGPVKTFNGVPLVPAAEYVHPLSGRARKATETLDAGAFEFRAD